MAIYHTYFFSILVKHHKIQKRLVTFGLVYIGLEEYGWNWQSKESHKKKGVTRVVHLS